ncbi:MAG: putative oxidoreductase [Acidobacteriota bacterium]|jgi:putative oxidoreductase|nr:putative oxidoreductase [Acidobacteriota bacterium]
MANLDSFYVRWTPRFLSILRIITGFLLMPYGAQKLFGFLAKPGAPAGSLPPLMWVAGILELFGGLLIFLGLFTRPTAFILSGFMAVAYFMMHAPKGFWPILNGGELAVHYCFVFLFLAVAGGGEWSLDHLLRRR